MTDEELGSVLVHARALLDGADQLDWIQSTRAINAEDALVHWTGPHADTFTARVAEEVDDLAGRARDMRREADEWAVVWADTLNQINSQRHEAAVDVISSQRGMGEWFFDTVLHGDDSAKFVPPLIPVAVPTAANRFQPTGQIEYYG